MTNARAWLKALLFVFVVFTAGYAVGKEVGVRRALERMPSATGGSAAAASGSAARSAAESEAEATVALPSRRLVARYYHATKRCVTCNKIEKQARAALENRFPEALADGRIVWETANMDDVWNAAAVEHYGLIRSSVVFIDMAGDVEEDYIVLNRAWDLYDEPERFAEYVQSSVEMIQENWVPDDEGEEEEE